MKNIYCVIVTYNGMQWMERCLSSLVQSTHPIIPVIIDNGSTDGTREYIETHYPQIPLMAQKTNLGFGQANNVGIRYSLSNGADYVLLLNQDAWIEKDMIDCLLSFADDNSLISPLHIDLEFCRISGSGHSCRCRAQQHAYRRQRCQQFLRPCFFHQPILLLLKLS